MTQMTVSLITKGHVMLFETLYNYRMKQEKRNQSQPRLGWMRKRRISEQITLGWSHKSPCIQIWNPLPLAPSFVWHAEA